MGQSPLFTTTFIKDACVLLHPNLLEIVSLYCRVTGSSLTYFTWNHSSGRGSQALSGWPLTHQWHTQKSWKTLHTSLNTQSWCFLTFVQIWGGESHLLSGVTHCCVYRLSLVQDNGTLLSNRDFSQVTWAWTIIFPFEKQHLRYHMPTRGFWGNNLHDNALWATR